MFWISHLIMNGLVVVAATDVVAKAVFIVAVVVFATVCDGASLNILQQKK
jgi:hypothetical protein